MLAAFFFGEPCEWLNSVPSDANGASGPLCRTEPICTFLRFFADASNWLLNIRPLGHWNSTYWLTFSKLDIDIQFSFDMLPVAKLSKLVLLLARLSPFCFNRPLSVPFKGCKS
jgi:hypothetical protein